MDSVRQQGYLSRVVTNELGQALSSFTSGFFNSPATVSDTLEVVGVLRSGNGRGRFSPILMPMATALRFDTAGLSNDPSELYATLAGGGALTSSNIPSRKEYPRVTLQLERTEPFEAVKDSIEARGYRTFSYAEQFEEITRFFVYFDMGLALIGLIALITASLGIVNTMVMAIMERRREIGVLRSLGATEGDIRLLFLFETGLIGFVGSIAGIILGWLVSRLCSAIVRAIMVDQGVAEIELFALPWWLIGLALLFGLVISVLAGAYPAARAARVDPMEALRVE
jgi:putative ABC transport system permease protein